MPSSRSFTFIDDCVEGVLRLTKSDFRDPLNIGSDEMVSMNEMMEMAKAFEGKALPIKHIPVRRSRRSGREKSGRKRAGCEALLGFLCGCVVLLRWASDVLRHMRFCE